MGLLAQIIDGRRSRNSHAQVVAGLGRDIVAGRIAEGSILPGDGELTTRFSVSRTVVREAMKTLAAKRLVEPKAKVGTRVLARAAWNLFDPDVLAWRIESGLDDTFIGDLADVRLGLEPIAAALAAERATQSEILELYDIAARMNDPAHTRESVARIDLEFHLAVARISKNPFMRSVSSLIEAALVVSFTLSSPVRRVADVEDFARNHLRIVQAIAAGDPARASAAMRHVIEVGVTRATSTFPDS